MPDDHPSPWKRLLYRSDEFETWINRKSNTYRVAMTIVVCFGLLIVAIALRAVIGD